MIYKDDELEGFDLNATVFILMISGALNFFVRYFNVFPDGVPIIPKFCMFILISVSPYYLFLFIGKHFKKYI